MVTAAHTTDNVSLGDPSTEAVPEATAAQMKVPDGMAVEDGAKLLALWMVVVAYEQPVGAAGPLPSCHSLTPDEWDNRCSSRCFVQSLLEVWRT